VRIAALIVPLAAMFAAPAFAQANAGPADKALRALFDRTDEAALKRNPLSALDRGDTRYADTIGDIYNDAHDTAEADADRTALSDLMKIDRAALTPVDRIAYDTFKTSTQIALAAYAPDLLAAANAVPINHFYGFHLSYADLNSGQGSAPFKTAQDYRDAIVRNRQFGGQIDEIIARFRQGLAAGMVAPKLVVRNMIEQIDAQTKGGVEGSPYDGPIKAMPDGIPAAERAKLTADLTASIRDDVLPPLVRLRSYLATDYLPRARDTVGLSGMKGGAALYRYDILQNTTLPLTAEQVHNLGLSEVARITREMDAIRVKTGFAGDLHAFFRYLSTDPKFAPPSRGWIEQRYKALGATIDGHIPSQFSLVPKTPLRIMPTPGYREKSSAGGEYQQGTPDGSRPGIFYYNGYDLPTRFTWDMDTLYLHEGIPGHHFQISIAQENDALPAFMRFGGNTAFAEGWALYAETLWPELGVETDPYSRFGGLNDEMLRAMRLVVDSGIHAMGWSREQAIAYMLANSAMGLPDVTAEVERYIAIPGQALAYKVGQLTILKEKAKAKAALGDRFDPRNFHAQVLETGALPMSVLEAKIDDWIAAGGK
jgi:uncharacterized protein (DUF885 family)